MNETEDLCDDDIDWEVNNDIIWNVEDDNKNLPCQNAVQDADTPDQSFLDVLHKSFGHRVFRPMQWKIITTILEGRDVCAIMATGYGKSLCYQFPSVFTGGITIVISPLISLMEDQVLSLEMSNIPACLLGSAQSKQASVITDILADKYTIIYATPEFCLGDYGLSILQKLYSTLQIDLLAIDEAHCVSQWGHDFRVQYRNLWKLRSLLQNVPILAVTATATPSVQTDIIDSLKLRDPLQLCSGFDRPNLYFEVRMRTTSDPYTDMKCFMVNVKNKFCFPGSTIVYCLTKKSTDDVVENLKRNGIRANKYHAGLPIKVRKEAHEQFVKDKVKVIVATIAFGMGIDKPDVRTIIHYGASKDIEGYYQEVGRAGRDGLPSKCIVFYSNSDFIIHRRLRECTGGTATFKRHLEQNSLVMEKYLNVSTCRRQFILEYFGEKGASNRKPGRNCCDNCTRSLVSPKIANNYEGVDDSGKFDLTEDAKLFLQAVSAMGGMFGIQMYILFIRGSKSSKLFSKFLKHPLYGKGKHMPDDWWKIVARILSAEEYLKRVFKKSANQMSFVTMNISDKGKSFIMNQKAVFQVNPPEDMKRLMKKKTPPSDEQSPKWKNSKNKGLPNLSLPENATASTSEIAQETESAAEKTYRMEVYKILLATRNDIAHNMDCMPYMVASNTALMQLAKIRPLTLLELKMQAIDGLNEIKIEKFGKQFIDCIQTYRSEHPEPRKEGKVSSVSVTSASSSAHSTKSEGWLCRPKLETQTRSVQDLKKFSFTERKVKEEIASQVDSTSPQVVTNAAKKRFSFTEQKNKLAQKSSQSDPSDSHDTSVGTSGVTSTESNLNVAGTNWNCSGNSGEGSQNKTKKFSFKKKSSLPGTGNCSLLSNDDTLCADTKESDVTLNNDTSYGWLDSPESKKDMQTNNAKRRIEEDSSFLLEEDSFDDDLMSAVDNIEKNIKVTEENPKPDTKNIALAGLPRKRVEQFDSWWAEKKKPKLYNYLDF